jgi:hypothetical protein
MQLRPFIARLYGHWTPRRIILHAGLAIALIIIGIFGWRIYWNNYYQGLLNASSYHPVYRDGSLEFSQYGWLNRSGQPGIYQKAAVSSLWTFTSPGKSGEHIILLSPYTYGDGSEFAETFQFNGGKHDGVGLVVHGNEATDSGMIFNVNNISGTWWFGKRLHSKFSYLQASIASTAIERNGDMDNILIVITRGDHYILLH